MAITVEQIFKAADELDAAGYSPTLAAIRKAIGGGSFTTISEAMNAWRARRAAQALHMREPAPKAIAEKLEALGGELWAVALEMANARLAAEREALESVRQEMEVARQEAAELADQLTVELDEAKASLMAAQMASTASSAEADQVRLELAAMRERAVAAEACANELRTELDHARQETRQLRSERDKAQEQATLCAGQVGEVRAEMATIQAISIEVERRNSELRIELDGQRKLMTRQSEKLEAIQAESEELRKAVSTSREEAATLRGRVAALEGILSVGGREQSP